MKKAFWGLALLLFFACSKPQEVAENISYYYDLEAFLQKLYPQKEQVFLKTTITEKQKQQKRVSDIRWEKELAFFEQANINKSALR